MKALLMLQQSEHGEFLYSFKVVEAINSAPKDKRHIVEVCVYMYVLRPLSGRCFNDYRVSLGCSK